MRLRACVILIGLMSFASAGVARDTQESVEADASTRQVAITSSFTGTEILLFGTRGKNARTLAPGRRQVNMIETRKREHSRKPDEQYGLIEACSPGPFIELFARGPRKGWTAWGNQADEYAPTWATYANHSQAQPLAVFDF